MIAKINSEKIFSTIIEAALLGAIFFTPIYFAFFQENFSVFDLNKSVWLWLCLTISISAWLILFSLNAKLAGFNSKRLFFAWLGFLLAAIISTVLSLHPLLSLFGSYERHQGLYNIIAYLLIFIFVVTFFQTKAQLRKIIIALNISAAIICLYGLTQALGLDWLYWSESISRIFSTFGQPNFFGHYLVVMIPLTIYSLAFISRRFWIRSLFLILLLSELICLFFTYSRGAWVAILVALFISLVYGLWHFKKRFLSLILIIFAIVVTVVMLLPTVRLSIISSLDYSNNSFFTRVASALDFSAASSSNSRLKYLEASWIIFKEAPLNRKLFGFGPDVLADVFVSKYQSDWAYSEHINSFPDRAHNNFFDTILQFGLVGWLSLLSLVFVCLKSLAKNLKDYKSENFWLSLAIGVSLIAYTVNNFFSFSLTAMAMLFFVLLALAWRSGNVIDRPVHRSINFFHPLSRWLISAMSIILLLVIFYNYDVRPLVADYYYMQVKRAEARKDCFNTLNNMENVMSWYPLSGYYGRNYLSFSINCFSAASSDEVKKTIINNILDQTKNLSPKENQFYTLIDLSHTYSILGYYASPKYYVIAENYYQEMLKLGPNITTIYQDYGRMKLWQAKYEEARQLFFAGIAITADPNFFIRNGNQGFIDAIANQLAYFHYLIGLTYKSENKLDQAIKEYKEAILIDPKTTSAYKDLADISYQQKNILEAINYNKQALAIEPDVSLWSVNLAKLYLEIGDKISALRYVNQAAEIEPNNKTIKDILEKLK